MISRRSLSASDWTAAGMLALAIFGLFGAAAGRLGFYADDAGWLWTIPAVGVSGLWAEMLRYVPGRNLHVLWQWMIYGLTGFHPVMHLKVLHLAHAGLEAAVASTYFLLLRLIALRAPAALMAAALFAICPAYGEIHYWLVAGPQNLISALFVIVFAITSVALLTGNLTWPVWTVDFAAFSFALYTYDQVFFALVLLAGLRLSAVLFQNDLPQGSLSALAHFKWKFTLAHFPYLAAGLVYAGLKISLPAGAGPKLQSHSLSRLAGNVLLTLSAPLSSGSRGLPNPWYARLQARDWWIAGAVAVALTAVGLWLAQSDTRSVSSRGLKPVRLALLGLLFFAAAFLPAWLWFVEPRHKYLPALGFFAAAGAALAWVFEMVRRTVLRALLCLMAGGATLVFAAMDLGESHSWQDSYSARKALFAALRPRLQDKAALVLEDFPAFLGPAPLISEHDATFTPRLLCPGCTAQHFEGSLSCSPAADGLFLHTLRRDGERRFLYLPHPQSLVVRFQSWENGSLKFVIDPPLGEAYHATNYGWTPARGPARIFHASAKRFGKDLSIDLDFQARLSEHTVVTAVFRFLRQGKLRLWTYSYAGRRGHVVPVILGETGPGMPPGMYEGKVRLRLVSFPETVRIRVELLEASDHFPPVPLAAAQAAVEP